MLSQLAADWVIENYCPIRNVQGRDFLSLSTKRVVCVLGGKFNKVLLHIKIM